MTVFKKKWAVFLLVVSSITLTPGQSYGFFGDSFILIPYLVKQLAEMYQQYAELQAMFNQGKASLDYIRWVNAGMDNVVGLISTLPIQDEKILADIRSLQRGTQRIATLYGMIPKSGVADMQTLHDQTIAESLEMTNSSKDYATGQEANANQAFQMANSMSPKGAERLSAATQAQVLHTMTQLLKVNAQLLKLQSEQFAMNNMQSKDSVNHFNKVNADMEKSLGGFSGDFAIPKF